MGGGAGARFRACLGVAALDLRCVDLGVRAGAPATEGDYPDGADAEGKQAETGRLGCCDDSPAVKKRVSAPGLPVSGPGQVKAAHSYDEARTIGSGPLRF